MIAAVLATVLIAAHGFRDRKKACGVKGVSIQIVNGNAASECEWPWQVGLVEMPYRIPFCGGTLLTPEWVLTAAHCIGYNSFYVTAGEHKISELTGAEQVVPVKATYKHHKFNRNTFDYDFALVKLANPFMLNDCVGTVCLPDDDVPERTACSATGWGKLTSGGEQSDVLRQAEMNIISRRNCVLGYGYSPQNITEQMFCARGRSSSGLTDTCQGDSGGPLVCQRGRSWTLYGVTSWGEGCGGYRYPGVYARVSSVRDWIDATLDDVPPPIAKPPCPGFCSSSKCWINACKELCGYC